MPPRPLPVETGPAPSSPALLVIRRTPCFHLAEAYNRLRPEAVPRMNLEVWLPALFALGLVVMGLMFAFVVACDKV
jgi:hypothetical protein